MNQLKEVKIIIPNINLAQTLDCGQAFRWKPLEDGSFLGAAQGYVAKISCNNDEVTILSTADKAFWENYFDVFTDYEVLKQQYIKFEQMKAPCEYAGGIRVLKQDGWEALASFIISQNNNIKRISKIIESLCENFGEPIEMGLYSFPTAERLAALTVEDLAPLRSGFRARYLIDAAQRVASKEINLAEIYTMPIEEARKTLMKIVGVGVKVADCALLFGFYRIECLPVDVWIRRALAELFPEGFPQELNETAGIAQQMIFHYMRTGKDTSQPNE